MDQSNPPEAGPEQMVFRLGALRFWDEQIAQELLE